MSLEEELMKISVHVSTGSYGALSLHFLFFYTQHLTPHKAVIYDTTLLHFQLGITSN